MNLTHCAFCGIETKRYRSKKRLLGYASWKKGGGREKLASKEKRRAMFSSRDGLNLVNISMVY